jgi:hypothetical protein
MQLNLMGTSTKFGTSMHQNALRVEFVCDACAWIFISRRVKP